MTPRQTRAVLLLIAGTTLARLLFAWAVGLVSDEAYMVASGRVLSVGYYDHPPAAWWLSWGASHLLGTEAPLAVRLPFVLLFALSTWLMYRLGAAVAGERAGFWAAVALNLSPVLGVTTGSWVLPDGPLVCALLGAALCLVHAAGLGAGGSWSAGTAGGGLVGAGGEALAGAGVEGLASTSIGGSANAGVGGRGGAGIAGLAGAVGGGSADGGTGWWVGAGVCAGLALLSKYSAVLSIAGAGLFLLSSPECRRMLRGPGPWMAGGVAGAMFAPVVAWNAAHDWVSFAFQGGRAVSARFHPLAPLEVLGGNALFILPWIWLPLMVLAVRAIRRGSGAERLLVWLAAPPIVGFALVAAWSDHRVLFHWSVPGYLMLFPLLGAAIAPREGGEARGDQPGEDELAVGGPRGRGPKGDAWVRGTVVGTAVLIVAAAAAVGAQARLDVFGPVIGAVTRKDPTVEIVDWTSIRAELTARGLLGPGTLVGLPNWRDGGKIAYGLGPAVAVTVLNPDARQFEVTRPAGGFVGRDVLVLIVENPEGTAAVLGRLFGRMERVGDVGVVVRGRELRRAGVFRGEGLVREP